MAGTGFYKHNFERSAAICPRVIFRGIEKGCGLVLLEKNALYTLQCCVATPLNQVETLEHSTSLKLRNGYFDVF